MANGNVPFRMSHQLHVPLCGFRHIVHDQVNAAPLTHQQVGPVAKDQRGQVRAGGVYPNKGTKCDIGLSLISDAHDCLPAGFKMACNG